MPRTRNRGSSAPPMNWLPNSDRRRHLCVSGGIEGVFGEVVIRKFTLVYAGPSRILQTRQ
jgi:hypothetical protein